jgi:hypothetical protein
MATRWAVASGNWSNPATWDGGTLPGAGDDVYADGKTVTVDISPAVAIATVRTQQRSGGTAGGSFPLADGVVLQGDAIAGSTACVTLSGAASAMLAGSVTGGSVINVYGAHNGGTGTLTVGLNAVGGSGSAAYGARNNGAGTITVGLNATGGSETNAAGGYNGGTGTLTVGLNAVGGSGSSASGAWNASTGTLTVGVNATGGSGSAAYGARNNGPGTLTVAGAAVGNDYGSLTNQTHQTPGVFTTAGATPCVIGGIEYGPYGQTPTGGRVHFSSPAPAGAIGWNSAGVPVPIGDATGFEFPSESDVRSGTEYAAGAYTGSCAVPVASTVLVGVPTDDTVGTLVQEIDTSALTDAVAALEARLAVLDPILPEVPSVVIPAPISPASTVAWCYCVDAHGAPDPGVEITIYAISAGADGTAFTPAPMVAIADAQGLATVEIPRQAGMTFSARRGQGRSATFVGVDADSLELPAILGTP